MASYSTIRAFVEHPLIRPNLLEERQYQNEIAKICTAENTLTVLPTGLGKTAIALLIIADFLSKGNNTRALMLAPTRVLVHQRYSFLAKHLSLPEEDIGVLTGEDSSEDRKDAWSKKLVCATPQVTLSELEAKNCRIEDFAIVIFDEVHRAIGNHAYSAIASIYNELRRDGRIVGMTASLPSDREKIEEIINKLKITKVEVRDEKSADVKPFVYNTETEWIELELSPAVRSIQKLIRDALDSRLKMMEDASLLRRTSYGSISLKDLLRLRVKVDQIQSSQLRSALFSGIRLFHALNLIETQSVSTFKSFMDRLAERKKGYGMSDLFNDARVRDAYEQARGALVSGIEHPKIAKVLELAGQTPKGGRAIIFASYRDTVDQIHSELTRNGFRAGYLIGKSGEGGQSQKKQIGALQQLREGVYDILVATQVGEEGLDVAECNLVIFYDNVPSAIRLVQRKGRTGRRSEGRVIVLITKGTKDETYYWLSRRRVGDARKIASGLVESKNKKKGPLDSFLSRAGTRDENMPTVYADTREVPELIEKLRQRGAWVEVKQLDFGDFVVSSDIVFERKTTDDFVKSIFDGRLFQQLANMTDKYARPILIIEGEKRSPQLGGISEAAFYGALASALSDFRVPIFFASNQKEVAEIIFHVARREQSDKKRDIRIREGRKPLTLAENQRYIVSGIPGISGVLADRLLSKFETVERLFSAGELDLQKVDGIGDVNAHKIRELATAKYVSATPAEMKKLAASDSLEGFDAKTSDLDMQSANGMATHSTNAKQDTLSPRPRGGTGAATMLEGEHENSEESQTDIPPPPSDD
ncbi:MAG TPA: DEAD/DEAH box helicase [Nitrososphaerales archaeon]|nr:DEAD/DEAH box helicase [Nitrososphaerales archaeon]